jgi:hypothetical protein
MTAACLAKLSIVNHSFLASVFPEGPTATAAVLVFFAVALAAASGQLILRSYGRRIARLMRMQEVAPPPASWYERLRRGGDAGPDAQVAEGPASLTDLQHAAAARLSAIRRATWFSYGVFLAISPVFLLLSGKIARGDLIGYCLAVPALAAVPALVNVQPQGSKRLVFVGMVLLGLVLGLLEPDTGEGWSAAVTVPLLLAGLYFVTAHRKLRTVVVVMSVWLTVVLTGLVFASWITLPVWYCMDAHSGAAQWSLAGADLTLAILVFTVFVHAGNRALHLLGDLHEDGIVSEISLASGAGLVLIAILLGFAISNDGPYPRWLVGLLTLVWIAGPLCTYAWTIRRTPAPAAQRSLLVLRVFSRHRATERLLDALQAHWRYVGPIHEIAGPDLARLNIDAHEMEKLVSARLQELFVFGAHDALVDSLDCRADREGRFRVNEIFCLESAWHDTVERLMTVSDAIVLDVRGFNPGRQGTGFEIECLARIGLLGRVLAIGDATTDWEYFEERIRAAGGVPDHASRVEASPGDSAERFLPALMQAACGVK